MNGFLETWQFTRGRLAQSWDGLSESQLHWRSPEGEGPIADILAHIAGCEHFLGKRILGEDPRATEADAYFDDSARAVFLNDKPFPWPVEDMTSEGLAKQLATSGAVAERALSTGDTTKDNIVPDSPLGVPIDGMGAAQRMAQHAAYHTGQIWMIRRHPAFPAE